MSTTEVIDEGRPRREPIQYNRLIFKPRVKTHEQGCTPSATARALLTVIVGRINDRLRALGEKVQLDLSAPQSQRSGVIKIIGGPKVVVLLLKLDVSVIAFESDYLFLAGSDAVQTLADYLWSRVAAVLAAGNMEAADVF